MSEFLQRLKERKLVQWTVAYCASAFALVQLLDIVAQRFEWPAYVMRLTFIALAIGFFVVLVLAWYHGERGVQRVTGTELLILALLLGVGGGFLWRFAGVAHQPVAKGVDMPNERVTAPPRSVAIPKKSIAVLPFENLSDDKSNAYFASGMQDMILTKLASIADLKVISRTSTEKYKSRPDDLKVVAQQLGVATILEGSVQKAGNQVLINLQLIDAASDHHLWADAYTRTLENVFGVEGEVAQKVADALKAKLTPSETAIVTRPPTQNAAAYDFFLHAEYQAKLAEVSWQQSTYAAAEADYRQALALDPNFALAYANLAYIELNRHWSIQHLTNEELADVKRSVEQALALAPDLPEAHLALGFYEYWGFRHYAPAVVEFQRTLELAPNNTRALAGLAFVARRTTDWQGSLTYFDKVLLLSPRDGDLVGEHGTTLELVRRFPEADRQLRRALALAPNDANAKDHLTTVRLFGFGDAKGARKAYQSPPEWRITSDQFTGDVMFLINLHAYPDVFERRFADASRAWDLAPTDTPDERLAGQVARIAIQIIAGQRAAVQAECEQLAIELEVALGRKPESLRLLQQLSWVEVGRGRNAEALQLAQRAVALLPLEKDTYFGTRELAGLAQIAAQTKAPDEALRVIQQLLSMPAGGVMTIERLRLDPVWDPLRKDARFQALLKTSAEPRTAP